MVEPLGRRPPLGNSPDATDLNYGAPNVSTIRTARDRIGRAVFKKWDKGDIEELPRLTHKFATP